MKMEMRNQNSNQEGKRGGKVFLSLLAILAMSSEAATHAAARVDVPSYLKVYITCVVEAGTRLNDCLRFNDRFEDYGDFQIFSRVCYADYEADVRACASVRPSQESPTPQISE